MYGFGSGPIDWDNICHGALCMSGSIGGMGNPGFTLMRLVLQLDGYGPV